MPYRKEGKQGQVLGFDWGRLFARVAFFLALGIGAGAGAASMVYEGECEEKMLPWSGGVCEHPEHHLVKIGVDDRADMRMACRCRKKLLNPVPNTLRYTDGSTPPLDEGLIENDKQ